MAKQSVAMAILPLCVSILVLSHLVDAQTSGSSRSARARAVLKAGASDSDPDIRREVAVALSVVSRGDDATSLLKDLAKDKDAIVREAAVVSIGELKDPKLITSARDALDDDVPEVAFAAARALFELKQPQGKEFLVDVVEKEAKAKSGFVRAKLRDVTRRMKRPKSAILFVARQGIGFVPVPGLGEGFSALSSLVSDADFSARATALLVLASDKSPQVGALIEQAFTDQDWSMRAAAVQIATSRNERQWSGRLIPLFDDTNRRVRYRAAASYLRLERRATAATRTVSAPTKK
jgi:HEAT repeat protein